MHRRARRGPSTRRCAPCCRARASSSRRGTRCRICCGQPPRCPAAWPMPLSAGPPSGHHPGKAPWSPPPPAGTRAEARLPLSSRSRALRRRSPWPSRARHGRRRFWPAPRRCRRGGCREGRTPLPRSPSPRRVLPVRASKWSPGSRLQNRCGLRSTERRAPSWPGIGSFPSSGRRRARSRTARRGLPSPASCTERLPPCRGVSPALRRTDRRARSLPRGSLLRRPSWPRASSWRDSRVPHFGESPAHRLVAGKVAPVTAVAAGFESLLHEHDLVAERQIAEVGLAFVLPVFVRREHALDDPHLVLEVGPHLLDLVLVRTALVVRCVAERTGLALPSIEYTLVDHARHLRLSVRASALGLRFAADPQRIQL